MDANLDRDPAQLVFTPVPWQDASLELAQATTLGCVIQRNDQALLVFTTVRVEDFDCQYRLIAEALQGLRSTGKPYDALAVVDEMTRRGTLGTVGGSAEVFRVAGFGFGDVTYSLDIIGRVARLRRLNVIGIRAQQWTESADADPGVIAHHVATQAQAVLDGIEAQGDVTTPTIGEFLQGEDAPYDWVIPGLLERSDRLVLTGSEGLGKSVLFRQLGVCAAAGVHPFTGARIPSQRVVYVDCENGVSQLRRAFRALVGQGKRAGDDPSSRLFLESRPSGLDLTRAEDEAWLVRVVAGLQPALLLLGPLYRLHAANPNDEEPARQVARVLDRCRAAANCAVVVEAHAGHGFGAGGGERPVRPTGTSLWLRWPEFGYGLRASDGYTPQNREVSFVAWRGDRSEREWPAKLSAGGVWPWSADAAPAWSPSRWSADAS